MFPGGTSGREGVPRRVDQKQLAAGDPFETFARPVTKFQRRAVPVRFANQYEEDRRWFPCYVKA